MQPARRVRLHGRALTRVDPTQAAVVGALAGDDPLLVVEGAAGAGKTTALRATRELLTRQRHRLMVVTPTLSPRSFKVGRHVRYWRADLILWLTEQTNRPQNHR